MTDTTTTVEELRELVRRFVSERQWEVFHTPKSLSMSIAIEAAELMELFQWDGNESSRETAQSEPVATEAADELADILIYCLALANVMDLDISQVVSSKLQRNNKRFPADQLPSRLRADVALRRLENST